MVRWPTTATAKSIVHGKISISTASQQINFHGIKYNFSRISLFHGTNTFSRHKNHSRHKHFFTTQTLFHGTHTFSRHKHCLTAKSHSCLAYPLMAQPSWINLITIRISILVTLRIIVNSGRLSNQSFLIRSR